jgi:hypothetical protein
MKAERLKLEPPARRRSRVVTLSGVVIPWNQRPHPIQRGDFKLACASGSEYFILSTEEWRSVLSCYCWREVKIVGLLDSTNLTLLPYRVVPSGPKGEKENLIVLSWRKGRKKLRKLAEKINDLILVPAAVLAVAGLEAIA